MASTKDHVEAYAYEGRRQATSLLTGSDRAGADPRRRLNRTTAGSLVVAVLAATGFGVAGLLGAGSGPAVPDSGAVLVKGDGGRYVAVNGVLHPALNLTSALLVGGGQVTEVRPDALGSRPRGLPVGIPNAPDALPQQGKLSAEPWTACTTSSAAPGSRTDLVIGPAPAEGRLGPDDALVVRYPDGRQWLLMQGRRFALDTTTQARLGLQLASPVSLPPEVLATVPEGPRIDMPQVAAKGTSPSRPIPGVPGVVGDLVHSSSAGLGDQYYVVEPDGLRAITPFVFLLLASSGARSVDVGPAVTSAAPVANVTAPGASGWPERKPKPVEVTPGRPVCFSTGPGAAPGKAPWQLDVSVPAAVPGVDVAPVAVTGGDTPGVLRSVRIPPGRGALVKAASSAGQDGAYTLVTDAGQRYALPGADAVHRLRYDPAAVKNVPAPFVNLLPSGPVLDPEAAQREFPGS
ncbi:type VII secretion protein EccB [Amycolatopsis sp. NPDC059027]|uniref:type VII secretion protein EccB n=1 Tax=Amycolatopsis sp. NPDC059027 TaxID=3346709 RepID=UPI003670501E